MRRQRGNLRFHPRNVRCAIHFSATTELDSILWIEPHELNLFAKFRAGDAENFLKHPRVEEEGGTKVELVTVGLDARGASANNRQTLDDLYLHSLAC